jgi:hypothetical protein
MLRSHSQSNPHESKDHLESNGHKSPSFAALTSTFHTHGVMQNTGSKENNGFFNEDKVIHSIGVIRGETGTTTEAIST